MKEVLREATVADVMTTELISCDPSTPLAEVAMLMRENRVDAVAVVSGGAEFRGPSVWGLVSDLDLVRAGVRAESGEEAGGLPLAPVVSVPPDCSLRDAAEQMLAHNTRHLLVTERFTHRTLGIVSSLDLAAVIGNHFEAVC